MYDIMRMNRHPIAMDALATPVMCKDISFSCLSRQLVIAAMAIYGLYQIVSAPWAPGSAQHSTTMPDILSMVFALLATLFLVLSRSERLLGLMSKLGNGVSVGTIGRLYVAVGSIFFAASLVS